MLKRNFFALLGLVLSFSSIPKALAQGEGRLLFANPSSGAWISGGVDSVGFFHQSESGTNAIFTNESHLVPTTSYLLSYVANTGKGASLLVDSRGVVGFDNVFSFSANWQTIVSRGNYLFFYGIGLSGGTNTGAVLRTYPDGTIKQTFSTNSFSPWSNVIMTDNYVFFYNKNNGVTATGELDTSGSFIQSATQTATASYTLVTSFNDDIFMYNFHNGFWESGPIVFTGSSFQDHYVASTVNTSNTLGLGYNEAVASNGHLMLYNSAAGIAAIGHFNQSGNFVLDRKQGIGKFYTNLLQCGQYLALYGFGTGTLQIGYIDPTGLFQPTSSLTIGGGLNVTATKN